MAEPLNTTRTAYRLRPVDDMVALTALAALAERHAEAMIATGLAVELLPENKCRLVIPNAPEGRVHTTDAARQMREVALAACTEAGASADGPSTRQPQPAQTAALLAPLDAALLIAARSEGGRAANGPQRLALITSRAPAEVAKTVAGLSQAGRDLRILATERGSAAQAFAVALNDDPADKSLVDSYLSGKVDSDGWLFLLVLWQVGAQQLWMPESARPASESLGALARILVALPDAGSERPAGYAIAECGSDRPIIVTLFGTEDAPEAGALAETLEPALPIDLYRMEMRPANADTLKTLADSIARIDRPLGYRIRLVRGPAAGYGETDVETLREQIRDLQDQIDRLQVMSIPQTRLMRFTDAQLPAMVDTLRRLRPEALQGERLRYAAGHAAGRSGPAHYLVYDPADEALQAAEAIWRAETEDRPMCYWLEPFMAEAAMSRPTRFRIFLPAGQFLEPSPTHFAGDLDDALKMIFGRLYGEASAVFADQNSEPYVLFTPVQDDPERLEVEIFDARTLMGLRLQLPWINDYLQLRATQSLDRSVLAEIALELYEGDAVRAQMQDMRDETQMLRDTWGTAQDSIRQEAQNHIGALVSEVEKASGQILLAHDYLDEAGRELSELESLVTHAEAQLRKHAKAPDTLAALDLSMRRAAEAFAVRVEKETESGEAVLGTLEAKIDALQRRLDALRLWRGQ